MIVAVGFYCDCVISIPSVTKKHGMHIVSPEQPLTWWSCCCKALFSVTIATWASKSRCTDRYPKLGEPISVRQGRLLPARYSQRPAGKTGEERKCGRQRK